MNTDSGRNITAPNKPVVETVDHVTGQAPGTGTSVTAKIIC